MLSRSRLMSRSADRDAPIALSCSSRWTRSSAAVDAPPENRRAWVLSIALLMSAPPLLLDANRAHLLHVGQSHHHLVHAVHLERGHPLFHGFDEQVGDPRPFLDELLHRI